MREKLKSSSAIFIANSNPLNSMKIWLSLCVVLVVVSNSATAQRGRDIGRRGSEDIGRRGSEDIGRRGSEDIGRRDSYGDFGFLGRGEEPPSTECGGRACGGCKCIGEKGRSEEHTF